MKKLSFKSIITLFLIIFSSPVYSESNWGLYSKKCAELSGQAALDACNMSIALMPADLLPSESAQVFMNRGIILGELGRTEEALKSFQQAKRLEPANAKIYYNIGIAMDTLGYTSKALRNYRKSVKLDPTFAEAWGNLGAGAYDLGKYKKSINAFAKAQKFAPAYFNSRAEQREMYDYALGVKPWSTALGREISLKITPNIGYLGKIPKDVFNQFLYIMPEITVDVQIYEHWFATGSFLYSRTTDSIPVIDLSTIGLGLIDTSGDMNAYGITFGVKYILRETDYNPVTDSFLDRSRFWTSVSAGPYITNLNADVTSSVALPNTFSKSRSITTTNFGFNAGIGFDYFFRPNFSIGLQFKVHYVRFSGSLSTSTGNANDDAINNALNTYLKNNDYIIFGGGPSLSWRF